MDKNNRQARWRRVLNRLLLEFALIPWLNLAVWTAFALSVRFALGHYPRFCMDNIPAPVGAIFAPLLMVSSWLLVLSVPVWLGGCLFWDLPQQYKNRAWRPATVYLLGWATTILVCIVDPVGFVKWFID